MSARARHGRDTQGAAAWPPPPRPSVRPSVLWACAAAVVVVDARLPPPPRVRWSRRVPPQSSSPARMAKNLAAAKFVGALTPEDITAVGALDRHRRFNDPAVFFERAFGTWWSIYD